MPRFELVEIPPRRFHSFSFSVFRQCATVRSNNVLRLFVDRVSSAVIVSDALFLTVLLPTGYLTEPLNFFFSSFLAY
jgi:hypothetical protein